MEAFLSDFTWINQGTSTATQSDGIVIKPEQSSTDNWRLLVQPIVHNFMVEASFKPLIMDLGSYGLFIGDGTGKMIILGASSVGGLRIMKYNDPTSWNSDYINTGIDKFLDTKTWLRIDHVADNLIFMISVDGANYCTLFTASTTDFLAGISQVGFAVNDSGVFNSSARVVGYTKVQF